MAVSLSSASLCYIGLLAVIFVVLKLAGMIDWDWWWVLCPLWGTAGLAVMIYTALLAVDIPVRLYAEMRRARHKRRS